MHSWSSYLKRGLSRELPKDRIAGGDGYSGIRANLKNLRPFIVRHWRKGVLGVFLIIFTTLFAFPLPLITRYIIDHVILARHLELLAGAVLLLIGITIAGKLTGLLEEFFFARFEEEVTLDIQQNLLERTLRFPKSFFDDSQTGYLMSRLSSDVEGLRWFFSSTSVHIISNMVRFVGGVGLVDHGILILDEPASALDSLAEKSIFRSLPAVIKGKTLFIVAHRLSTIRDSDRILLLDENRLIASGTHQLLMETNDYYRSLVAYQRMNGDEEGE